jgi:integrase
VKLFKKKKSKFYWYDFAVRGQRYRGSTEETNFARAGKIAGLRLAAALEGSDPLDRKAPVLDDFSPRFLKWVTEAKLEEASKLYYRDGWKLLSQTKLKSMRIDQITNDDVEKLPIPGSASNFNCAVRTLSRMLHKAEEWKLIRKAPRLKRAREFERQLRLDDEAEKRLLAGAAECGWREVSLQLFEDVVKLMRDSGMRNRRELYRLRIENIDWRKRNLFIPDSKTEEGTRTVPMSDRVCEILRRRCAGKTSGWVFPARRKGGKNPYLGSIAKHFAEAREKAGLPKSLVLYCSRADFGTVIMIRTGNLKAVMKVMGHRDVKTAMKYQRPEVDIVRAALNTHEGVRAAQASA